MEEWQLMVEQLNDLRSLTVHFGFAEWDETPCGKTMGEVTTDGEKLTSRLHEVSCEACQTEVTNAVERSVICRKTAGVER